jgi:hypothetical protein
VGLAEKVRAALKRKSQKRNLKKEISKTKRGKEAHGLYVVLTR